MSRYIEIRREQKPTRPTQIICKKTTRPGRLDEYLKGLSVILSFFSLFFFFFFFFNCWWVGGSVDELIIIVIAYRFTSSLLPWVSLPPSVSGCSTLYLHFTLQRSLGPTGLVLQRRGQFLSPTLHLHYITVQPGTYRICPAAPRAVSEHYITMEPGTYRTCPEAPRAVSEHYITLEPGTYWPWPAAP